MVITNIGALATGGRPIDLVRLWTLVRRLRRLALASTAARIA